MAMCKAMDVAKWFIVRSADYGDTITNLKVQKLLYYSEAWCQVLLGKTLFEEDMEAWARGPAVPAVFFALKALGRGALPVADDDVLPDLPAEAVEILEKVLNFYAPYSVMIIEEVVQREEPWLHARGSLDPEQRCTTIIPTSEIRAFFKARYEATE